MTNPSIIAAFERMWQHVLAAVETKADSGHLHNDTYYTKTEIDNSEIITIDDIDSICGGNIVPASEVTF